MKEKICKCGIAVSQIRKFMKIIQENEMSFVICLYDKNNVGKKISEVYVQNNKIIEEEKAAGNFTGAVRIIGNLPYYITTPIIMGLLESGVKADSITVMMQKEVADRIKASPGSKTYGAISAAVQYYCIVEQIASVPKEVFVPRPKVDSAVLNLHIRKEKPVELTDEKMFFACIRSGFGQRRKTLLNSLTGTAGLSKEDIRNILSTAGIDPVRRAETLNMEEFAAIANEAAACSRRQRNE